MELNVSKLQQGLNPAFFLDKDHLFDVVTSDGTKESDCVTLNTSTSSKGNSYEHYTLFLLGKSGNWVGEYAIKFLFMRDLQELIEAWGANTSKWAGQRVIITAKVDGEYNRWHIKPFPETQEVLD